MVEISGAFAEQSIAQRNVSETASASSNQRNDIVSGNQQNAVQSGQNGVAANVTAPSVERNAGVTGTPEVNAPVNPANLRENTNDDQGQQRFIVDQVTLSREAQTRLQADAQDQVVEARPASDIADESVVTLPAQETVDIAPVESPDVVAASNDTLSAQDTAEDTVIVADPSDGIVQSVAEEPENTIVAQNSVVSAEEPTEALGVLNQTTNQTQTLEANTSVVNGNLDGQSESNRALGQVVDQFA